MRFDRWVVAVLAVAACVAAGGAQAQATGRVVLGFAAGGAVAIVTTFTADKLREGLGRPFIHENRAGGEGIIAIDVVKASEPNGNTLLMTPIANICIYPHTYKKLPYDPQRDLVPVAMVGAYHFALAVGPASQAKDLAGFNAWAKANPKQATFGTPGRGNIPHFYGLMFASAAGIELTNVPYKGSAPVINDLLGGHVAAGVTTLGDFLTQVKAGKLRVLAHSGKGRSPLAPEAPTFAELGYKNLQGGGWYGLFAPAGTPAAVVERINRIVVAGQQAPDMSERMRGLGLEIELTTPAEFAAIVRADSGRWGAVIRAAGFAGSQ
ncbi:MAG: Bug family tripartite tricarboxylate transporter substrate binding protein [Burkholderiales bacterium]|nr:Bug family tripartite tricarboxylate transporter substrate binding protein [Burkholderiales bacterium]